MTVEDDACRRSVFKIEDLTPHFSVGCCKTNECTINGRIEEQVEIIAPSASVDDDDAGDADDVNFVVVVVLEEMVDIASISGRMMAPRRKAPNHITPRL
jgi:hypothetical protein